MIKSLDQCSGGGNDSKGKIIHVLSLKLRQIAPESMLPFRKHVDDATLPSPNLHLSLVRIHALRGNSASVIRGERGSKGRGGTLEEEGKFEAGAEEGKYGLKHIYMWAGSIKGAVKHCRLDLCWADVDGNPSFSLWWHNRGAAVYRCARWPHPLT